MERRPPDAVALDLDEVAHRRVPEPDRVRLPHERAVRARGPPFHDGADEPERRGIEAAVLADRLLGEGARGRVPRIGRGLLLGEEPPHGENAAVRRDGRPVLELLERLDPPDGPAPDGHARGEERVRLLEPERALEEDLRLVVDVERRERTHAGDGEAARLQHRLPARDGLRARDLEVDRGLRKRAREARAPDERARGDHGEADPDEGAVPPVEPDGRDARNRAHPAALRAGAGTRERSHASRSSLPEPAPVLTPRSIASIPTRASESSSAVQFSDAR